jgi:hypothetical protein
MTAPVRPERDVTTEATEITEEIQYFVSVRSVFSVVVDEIETRPRGPGLLLRASNRNIRPGPLERTRSATRSWIVGRSNVKSV